MQRFVFVHTVFQIPGDVVLWRHFRLKALRESLLDIGIISAGDAESNINFGWQRSQSIQEVRPLCSAFVESVHEYDDPRRELANHVKEDPPQRREVRAVGGVRVIFTCRIEYCEERLQLELDQLIDQIRDYGCCCGCRRATVFAEEVQHSVFYRRVASCRLNHRTGKHRLACACGGQKS